MNRYFCIQASCKGTLPLNGKKKSTLFLKKKRKKKGKIQGKQVIRDNSLKLVSSLMNFNAGYQLESKQFQRKPRSFAALSCSLLRKLSVREDVNRAWESSLITFRLPSISAASLSLNHVLALWIMFVGILKVEEKKNKNRALAHI